MSDKIRPEHLKRKAVLYVRQSTASQLQHSEESRRLQYAMRSRIHDLGWQQIETIDDDLGRSASGTTERRGFERMVAEVGLGHVGAVCAREVSRFARNSRDWQQLVEMCRLVDTLLVDHDTVYDPRASNDRLLLGLKGSLNEYELDLLRIRASEAREAMARRGELLTVIPVGYVKNEDGVLDKDPDQRVRHRIELLFDKLFELGSVRQLMLWLRDQDLLIPSRGGGGALAWKTARYTQLLSIVKNPVYAGAYAWAKTATVHEPTSDGGVRRRQVTKPRDEWVLLKDHHEGYISWEHYERLQVMIEGNAQGRSKGSVGAAKKGQALLSGLLRCRRCARKLTVQYNSRHAGYHRYTCSKSHNVTGRACTDANGLDVDARVAAEVLGVVQPAAVQAARVASRRTTSGQVLEALQLELQQAEYAAQRAWRQYDAVDPDNRLVADELERRYNDALEKVEELRHRIEDHNKQIRDTKEPSAEQLAELPEKLALVWDDPHVDHRLRKRIVRTLIEEVVAEVDSHANEIVLVIHWKGGVHTELRVSKRRAGKKRFDTSVEIIEAVRVLARVCDDVSIARWLGRAGTTTAHGKLWSRERVASLRSTHGIPRHCPDIQRSEGWLTKNDAAKLLDVADRTVLRAIEAGVLPAERPLPNGPSVVRKADLRRPDVVAHFDRVRRRPGRRVAQSSEQMSFVIPNR